MRVEKDRIIELRQYTLRGGRRDTLIDLFEAQFIESQNAEGAHVIGTFRDLDDPDRFVWLRGFPDMAVRRAALERFYGGPVWQAHRDAANATMIDSDNVLMLRPMQPDDGFDRLARGEPGLLGARIHALGDVPAEAFADWFDAAVRPMLAWLGATEIVTLATETAPNDFPRLPIRPERVFAWFARWSDAEAEQAFAAAFASESGWRDGVPEALLPALVAKPERLRLAPTQGSPFR